MNNNGNNYNDYNNGGYGNGNNYSPRVEFPHGFGNPGMPYNPLGEQNKKLAKKTYSRLGFGMLAFVAVVVSSEVFFQNLFYYLTPDFYASQYFTWVLSVVPLYGIGLPVLYLIIRNMEISKPAQRHMNAGQWVMIFIVSYGTMMIGSIAGNYVMNIIGIFMNYDYTSAITEAVYNSDIWISVAATVVIAPIGEEFIFRKLFIDRLRSFGDVPAILTSALLFGLFHGNLYQFFYAFLLGIILGYVYTSTGKIYLAMLLHASVNFIGSVVTRLIYDNFDVNGVQNMTDAEFREYVASNPLGFAAMSAFNFFTYGCIIGGVIIFFIRRRHIFISRGTQPLSRGDGGAAISNPGMICAIVACCSVILLSLVPVRG